MLNKKVGVSNFKVFLVKKRLFYKEMKYIVILKKLSYTNYTANCVTTFSRKFITNIFLFLFFYFDNLIFRC